MNVTVIQAPPFEPLSLADCYDHLRLDPEGSPPAHAMDSWLTARIVGARTWCENVTRRSFIQQTLRLSADRFGDGLELLRGPVIEVLSVSYYDSTNTLQSLDAASYYLTDDVVPQVRLASNVSPSLYDRPDAVRVEYVAGYAPSGSPTTTQEEYTANVPMDIKHAMLLLIAEADAARRDGTMASPYDEDGPARALLGPYVVQIV